MSAEAKQKVHKGILLGRNFALDYFLRSVCFASFLMVVFVSEGYPTGAPGWNWDLGLRGGAVGIFRLDTPICCFNGRYFSIYFSCNNKSKDT